MNSGLIYVPGTPLESVLTELLLTRFYYQNTIAFGLAIGMVVHWSGASG